MHVIVEMLTKYSIIILDSLNRSGEQKDCQIHGGDMEKRYRDYLRHLEKLDFEVLSEDEVFSEREGIVMQATVIHQELMRTLTAAMGFLICAVIFLAVGLMNFFFVNYICAAVFAIVAGIFALHYKDISNVMKKMYFYIDKLTRL